MNMCSSSPVLKLFLRGPLCALYASVVNPSFLVIEQGAASGRRVGALYLTGAPGCAHGGGDDVNVRQLLVDLRTGPADMCLPVLREISLRPDRQGSDSNPNLHHR